MIPHTLPEAIRLGVWIYTAEATLGVALGLAAIADAIRNLRAVRRLGIARPSAAWLWLGLGATAFLAQIKLAVIGLFIVARPSRPMLPSEAPANLALVSAFVVAGLIVLGIQIATILGRSALRGHQPKESAHG